MGNEMLARCGRVVTSSASRRPLSSVAQNMVRVTFVDHEGMRYGGLGLRGSRLIDAAVRAGVPLQHHCGIHDPCVAFHIVPAREVRDTLPAASEDEKHLIETLITDAPDGSRLGCQMAIDKFAESVVFIPKLTPC